jgi:exosome complex component CSL4
MFVMPGDRIGCVEEFEAGEGIYEENGVLYASIAGELVVEGKKVSVKPIKEIPKLEDGDVIVGKVIDLRNSIAVVKLLQKKGVDRDLTKSSIGILHVSNVQAEFLKDLSSAIGYGDIIKAKIIDAENLKLSTKEDDMGVIKSRCSLCRYELILDGNKLKCPRCGNEESRKVSSDYGKGVW